MTLLSICIPTKNRINYLKRTIQSIIDDDVDPSLYEIVISDNSDNDEVKEYIETLSDKKIKIIFFKNELKGFYNSVKALSFGTGDFLKLHNDYSMFSKGSFKYLVELVESNNTAKPIIFFSNGELKSKEILTEVKSFNEFIASTSYLNTWSSAFSIWKSDFINTKHDIHSVDSMFPHTSIIFNCVKNEYIICNKKIMENISVEKKGGYNIFYNFCVIYLEMLQKQVDSNKLKAKVFDRLKSDMLLNFIAPWYFKTITTDKGYTFDNHNADLIIKRKYGLAGLLKVKVLAYLRLFKEKIYDFVR